MNESSSERAAIDLGLPAGDPASPSSEAAPAVVAPADAGTPLHSPIDPAKVVELKLLEGKIIEVLQQIYDPEIPLNIYELGLIYDIHIEPDHAVKVKMTLTAPACPVAGSLPGQVEQKIEEIPEVKSADVELVWDPPWSRDRMSEAALLQLGML
jgi:FeS assembly SUF system protein